MLQFFTSTLNKQSIYTYTNPFLLNICGLPQLLRLGQGEIITNSLQNFTQAVLYDLFSSAVFLPYSSILNLSLPLLGLGSKSTSLSPGFCVRRPRQYDTICCKLNLISGIFLFFLAICFGGWNQQLQLVSSRRQGVLTQGPAQDPKSKLNISSFLTLLHLLDCLICTRNSVLIVLLL